MSQIIPVLSLSLQLRNFRGQALCLLHFPSVYFITEQKKLLVICLTTHS